MGKRRAHHSDLRMRGRHVLLFPVKTRKIVFDTFLSVSFWGQEGSFSCTKNVYNSIILAGHGPNVGHNMAKTNPLQSHSAQLGGSEFSGVMAHRTGELWGDISLVVTILKDSPCDHVGGRKAPCCTPLPVCVSWLSFLTAHRGPRGVRLPLSFTQCSAPHEPWFFFFVMKSTTN